MTPHRGMIRPQLRRDGQCAEEVLLPREWLHLSVNPALQLIDRIYKLVATNQETLRGALAIILTRSDTIAPAADWEAIATSLRNALQNGHNQIRAQTWRSTTRPTRRNLTASSLAPIHPPMVMSCCLAAWSAGAASLLAGPPAASR